MAQSQCPAASVGSNQAFLQSPEEANGVEALRSIDSWPSQVESVTLTEHLSAQSSMDPVSVFCRMSGPVQREFAYYPGIVKQAFSMYADTGNAGSVIEWVVEEISSMLFRQDHTGYIPIEAALEARNGAAVKRMLEIAKRSGSVLLERLLKYKNPRFKHSLLMLAVKLNSREYADIFHELVNYDPGCIYRCYDDSGRNVFHWCAKHGCTTSIDIVFGLLIERFRKGIFPNQCLNEIIKALEMPDRRKNTPMHYVASSGNLDMLKSIQAFLNSTNLELDFDAHFVSSNSLTPLVLAVQSETYETCKWLLENGSVDVHFKQRSTCLTALHFAVRAGNPELIALLMKHGADFDYTDSDCADLAGYKTPLDMALSEDIPRREACLRCLRSASSSTLASLPGAVSGRALGDVTNAFLPI